MTPFPADPMRFARVICLSIIYMLLVLLIWTQISEWTIAHASPSVASAESLKNLKRFGHLFVFLNSLVFAASLVWLARTREFSSVARYLVPTVLAVAITYLMLIPVLMIEGLPSPDKFVAIRTGLLIYWMDSVMPGLAAAQIFRFPRHRARLSSRDVPSTEAV